MNISIARFLPIRTAFRGDVEKFFILVLCQSANWKEKKAQRNFWRISYQKSIFYSDVSVTACGAPLNKINALPNQRVHRFLHSTCLTYDVECA